MSENVSDDFVFGTLATDALRLGQMRSAQSGVAHAHRLQPADPQPNQPVTLFVKLGPAITADRVTCYYTTDGSEPHGERGNAAAGDALDLTRDAVEWNTLLWGYVETWSATIPPQTHGTTVRYRIEAWREHGTESHWANEMMGVVRGERPTAGVLADEQPIEMLGAEPLWPIRRTTSYAYHVDHEHVPNWLRDAVIYHVFIDRFAPDPGKTFATPETPGGFYGGTLRGLIERLEYIADLGVTCLWLSPLFPSPSHHGYDATDYGSVEPRLGSAADLHELIAAAHGRGLRVLLDYVVNHISNEHPVFQAALAQPDAPEAAWFTWLHWPNEYLSFFGVRELPQIDSDAPPARDYMIEHACRWLAQGVDGFRLDYANGPSHTFWSMFRAATRAAKPDSVMLGEVVETAALQRTYAGRMDGCLDFLLLQALRQFFAFGSITPSAFDSYVRRHLAFFASDFVLPSFLDNHDMNRFLWIVGNDPRRLKLAALCQFTLPNPPIVYYGTEVGLSQVRDVRYADGSGHPEESRLPMLWDDAQNAELREFYRHLITLRRDTAPLWRGDRQTLVADDQTGLYVYRCTAGSSTAIVALNNGGDAQSFAVTNQTYRLALSSDHATTLDGAGLILAAWSGAIVLGGEEPSVAI